MARETDFFSEKLYKKTSYFFSKFKFDFKDKKQKKKAPPQKKKSNK
jgi:hypothetical protein